MKKSITTTIVTGMIAGSVLAGSSFTTDFASAYVFRGATLNDGFVIQPGVEVDGFALPEEYGAIAVGAWGNFDIGDYDETLDSSQFSEVDWYAAYSLPSFVEGLDLSLGFTEYTYPLGGVADKEVSVGLGYEIKGIGLGANLYSMVGGDYVGQVYFDLSASYAYEITEGFEASVGALIGYIKQGNNEVDFAAGGADDGLNDLVLDATIDYALGEVWSVGASLAYIGQLDDQVLVDVDNGGSYDVDVVGMLSIGASF